MKSLKLTSKQTFFEVNAWLVGLCVFGLLATCVKFNDAMTAVCLALVALWAAPGLLIFQFEEVDGKARLPYSLKRDGWTYVFGGPLITAMVAYAATGWSARDNLPEYVTTGWWPVACFIAGQAFGFFWRLFDNAQYHNQGLYQMLKSPSKWWIDYVQMPLAFSLVLTWVAPQIVIWGPYSVEMSVLLGLLGVLMVVDLFLNLKPRDKHIRWNAREFRPL